MAEARRRFPGTPDSVPQVREFVRATLDRWRKDDADSIAVLLASELATNAVVHVSGAYEFSLELADDELRLACTDGRRTAVQLRAPELDAPSGRGLMILDHLSSSWGCDQLPGGKVVWATIALS